MEQSVKRKRSTRKQRIEEKQRRKRSKRKLEKKQRTKKSHLLLGGKSGTRGRDKKTINNKIFYASQMIVRFCECLAG